MSSEAATPRAQPYYCPYCSEEDFVPFGEEPGRFFCNSCNRHYAVRFFGLGRASEDETSTFQAPPPGPED
jgi:transposase-like protein